MKQNIEYYESVLNEIFNKSKYNEALTVKVYLLESNKIEFRIDGPSDILSIIDAKRIEDPVLFQTLKMWVDAEAINKSTHRLFRIEGTEDDIMSNLGYLKMVM